METDEKTGMSLSDVIFVGGLAVASVLIPLVVAKLHCFAEVPAERALFPTALGALLGLVAGLLVGFNLYTSLIRPWMFHRAHGSLEGYQHVSGAPAASSILIAIAALLLPGSMWIGVVLLILYFSDPAGILVAAIVFIRDCFSGNASNP